MIAASDREIDIVGWGCPLLVVLLLVLSVAAFMCVRLWRWMMPVTRCPRCKDEPDIVDFYNRCAYCGCEYDKWGKILNELPRVSVDALDLARFNPPGGPCDQGETEFKTGEEVER